MDQQVTEWQRQCKGTEKIAPAVPLCLLLIETAQTDHVTSLHINFTWHHFTSSRQFSFLRVYTWVIWLERYRIYLSCSQPQQTGKYSLTSGAPLCKRALIRCVTFHANSCGHWANCAFIDQINCSLGENANGARRRHTSRALSEVVRLYASLVIDVLSACSPMASVCWGRHL